LSQSTSSTSESNKWRMFRLRHKSSQSTPDTSPSVYNDPFPPDTLDSGDYKNASRMVPSRSATKYVTLPQSRKWDCGCGFHGEGGERLHAFTPACNRRDCICWKS
jgi:hypothetical protein